MNEILIDKDDLTWEQLMALPDTPVIAELRTYEKLMWFAIGKYEQRKVAA